MARLEALTTGQLLDRIFAVYRKHFVLFFAIAIIPQLSRIILLFGPAPTVTDPFGSLGLRMIWVVVYIALLAVCQGATATAVSDVYLEKPVSVGSSYRTALPMTMRLIGMMFGYALLVGFGFILLIVPGVYFLITYALATAVMAIERVSFSESMTRSKHLVVGNRGRIAVIFLLSLIMSWVIGFGLGIPAGILNTTVLAAAPFARSALGNLTVAVAAALSTPIGLIGYTLAYYDARVRKEAFDLEYMMESDAATMPLMPAEPPMAPVEAFAATAAAATTTTGSTIAATTGGSTFMLFDDDTSAATPKATTEKPAGTNES